MMTHSEIISLFMPVGKVKYERLSEASGLSAEELARFKYRGSIPPSAWPMFVAAAEKLGIEGVTFEALAKAVSRDEAAA